MVDVIVIGGGIHGMVAALTSAKAGRQTVILEQRPQLGGLASGLGEFPQQGAHWDTAYFSSLVIESLGLKLETQEPAPIFIPGDGKGLLLSSDLATTVNELEAINPADARAYSQYRNFLDRIRPVMRDLLLGLPRGVDELAFKDLLGLLKKGLGLRRLGKADMLEVLRVPLMCTADYLAEYFENDAFMAALALPAHAATTTGPWSPGTMLNLLLLDAHRGRSIVGGASQLVKVLQTACENAGIQIIREARVDEIRIKAGQVQGVIYNGGEQLDGRTVLSSCHPKQVLLDLIEPGRLPYKAERAMELYRARGTTSLMQLKLKDRLRFECRPDLDWQQARIVTGIDDLERSFDHIKYAAFSQTPALELSHEAKDIVNMRIHFAPIDLKGGWTEAAREGLAEASLKSLARFVPNLSDLISERQLLTPADLEAAYLLPDGHIGHGEWTIDQLIVRPTLECAGYQTPVQGLFLCGMGTQPGIPLSGLSGLLAAQKALG